MTAIQLVDLGEPGILAQQIGQGAALKPLTVQPPFAARRQQAVGDQYEQYLIPARPLAAHAKPLAPEQIQLQLPPQQQRQPARAPLPRPAQLQLRQLDADNRSVRQLSFAAVFRKQRQRAGCAAPSSKTAIDRRHANSCVSLISPRYSTCRCAMRPPATRMFSTTLQ